jgi:hypothetical protein
MTVLIGVLGLFVGLALVARLLVVLHRSRITPFDISMAQFREDVYQFGVQLGNALTPVVTSMCRTFEEIGRVFAETVGR